MKLAAGRMEKRSRKVATVRLWTVEQPAFAESVTTENVSTHGARIVTSRALRPSARLFVTLGGRGPLQEATVIYCRPAAGGMFETGLRFGESIWEYSDALKPAEFKAESAQPATPPKEWPSVRNLSVAGQVELLAGFRHSAPS